MRAMATRSTAKTELMTLSGNARAILAGERAALNFVGHLSGVATATAAFVARVGGTKTRVTCTRKTTPGLRALQKYAVRCGGGFNHRFGLDDAILIKDNHIAVAGGIRPVLERAKSVAGHLVKIEIEVDNLDQLREVLDCGLADVVLLDNMDLAKLKTAVDLVAGRLVIEASGGITLDNARRHRAHRRRLCFVGRASRIRRPISTSRSISKSDPAAALSPPLKVPIFRRIPATERPLCHCRCIKPRFPCFPDGLSVLASLAAKSIGATRSDKDVPPDDLINARLAPDMLPLSGQIQRASDTSKLAIERLTGIPSPRFEDKENTLCRIAGADCRTRSPFCRASMPPSWKAPRRAPSN